MLHCCLHLTWFAHPGAEAKEGHLRAVVQCEGGVHDGAELQADVAPQQTTALLQNVGIGNL